jgi:hypothetical protein
LQLSSVICWDDMPLSMSLILRHSVQEVIHFIPLVQY